MATASDTSANTQAAAQSPLRDALLAGRVVTFEDTTNTVAVMLRVSPLPGVFASVANGVAAQKVATALGETGIKKLNQGDLAHLLETSTTPRATLVLTDDMELVRNLRAASSDGTPYVIALTTNDEYAIFAALCAGADDCIDADSSPSMIRTRVDLGRRFVQLGACLRSALRAHRKLATTDELTRVANRHFFSRHFPLEAERAARYGHALSIVTCEVDRFKQIGTDFGHSAGDALLREFATRLQQCLRRGTDWVARVGGEEFSIVLPETGLAAATQVAAKLCERIRAQPFDLEGCQLAVTASFGVCGTTAAVPTEHADIPDRLQATADAALYRSKREGRNRVTAAALDLGGARAT